MNILLLNHYAGSPELGMEYRPYFLAREWVRAGHRVQIVAADHSHVRTRQPDVGDAVIDGIAYRWLATPAYRGNGVGRLRNIAAFLRRAAAEARSLAVTFRPDVVIGSSTYPMDCWVARRIARHANATLVHEVHDLWPLSPIELSGMSPWHPFALWCGWAENSAYRHADLVVSMLPKVHAHMAAHGLDLKRLAIVPNGVAVDEGASPTTSLRHDVQQLFDGARVAAETCVAYTGSMGEPNALDTLLDAAGLLRNAPLRFVLVGDGHLRAHLAARIAAERLDQVVLLPPVPKAQVAPLLAQADIAYIGWQPVPIYRFGIAPNKLMDYMLAGCAVLHAVAAGNDPVAESGCGLTVAPGDAQAVAHGLQQLAALPREERVAMGRRGRDFVLTHHTYPVLAERFLDAVRQAPRRAPRR